MSNLQIPACAGQSAESVEQWLRTNAATGVTLVLRHTQGNLLRYEAITVDGLGRGRIYTTRGSFYFSGKNCFHPKGQSRLVASTPETLEATKNLLGTSAVKWSALTVI